VTVFDLIVLLVIGVSSLLGVVRGLLKELLSLIAYALAFLAAVWWGADVATWFESWIDHVLIRMGAAYGLVFLAALLMVGCVNLAASLLIQKTGLTPADRGLGLLFGFLRGLLVVFVAVTLIGYTELPREPWWQNAVLSKPVITGVLAIKSLMPPALAAWVPYFN